ncbi:hypothetical protein [Parajeilongvirus diaemi]|nr:hypothetical protein [Diaemus bat paramyxovirus]
MSQTTEYVDMTQLSDHTYDTVNTHSRYYGSKKGFRISSKKLQLIDNTYKLTSNLYVLLFIILILLMINIVCSVLVPIYTRNSTVQYKIRSDKRLDDTEKIDEFTLKILKSKIDHMLQILSYRLPSDFQTFIRKLTEETLPLKIIDTLLSNTNKINLDLKLDKAKNLLFKISSVETDPEKLTTLYKWINENSKEDNSIPIYTINQSLNTTNLPRRGPVLNHNNKTIHPNSNDHAIKHLYIFHNLTTREHEINTNLQKIRSEKLNYGRPLLQTGYKNENRNMNNRNVKFILGETNQRRKFNKILYKYSSMPRSIHDNIEYITDFILTKILKSAKIRWFNLSTTYPKEENCDWTFGFLSSILTDIQKSLKSIDIAGFNKAISNKYDYKLYTLIKELIYEKFDHVRNQNNRHGDVYHNNIELRYDKTDYYAEYSKRGTTNENLKQYSYKNTLNQNLLLPNDHNYDNDYKRSQYLGRSRSQKYKKRHESSHRTSTISQFNNIEHNGKQSQNQQDMEYDDYSKESYHHYDGNKSWKQWSNDNGMRMNLKYNRLNLSIDDFDYSYYQFCGNFIKYKQVMIQELLKFLKYTDKWLYCYDYRSVYTVIEKDKENNGEVKIAGDNKKSN